MSDRRPARARHPGLQQRGHTRSAMLLRSARFPGATAALHKTIVNPLPLSERAAYERARETISVAMGEVARAAEWTEGQALTLEQALDIALET